MRGGKREGAGRKKGSATKRTREIANAAAASGLTPLEYMLRVMQDETVGVDRRDWAAGAAAPYCHPKLQPIDPKTGSSAIRVIVSSADLALL